MWNKGFTHTPQRGLALPIYSPSASCPRPSPPNFGVRTRLVCGFTILEVLFTILVISIGALTAFVVVQQIISQTFSSSYRLTAAYLAKEGIEIVRNTRDTNWLEGENWDNGLSSSGWEECVIPKYERRIIITPDGVDKLKVVVDVKWEERGNTYTITVQENLYNWY